MFSVLRLHYVYLVNLGVKSLSVFFYEQRYVLWIIKQTIPRENYKIFPIYQLFERKAKEKKEKEWLNSDRRIFISLN